MTHEEFKEQLFIINRKCEFDKVYLANKCAKENNPYKIGDIIESDCNKKIEINKIQSVWSSYSDIPQMIYTGLLLTKTGSYNKKIKTSVIFQSRILK